MRWIVITPFTHTKDVGWIPSHINNTKHTFEAVEATYHHDRSRSSTSAREWLDYGHHAFLAWIKAMRHGSDDVGFITSFPQLPVFLGLFKRLSFSRRPIIAWTFNLGHTYGGFKGFFARFALRGIDLFIVHSSAEITSYSRWLKLPPDRFLFVPLAITPVENIEISESNDPFVLAMGTANRDYFSLVQAVEELGYRTIIVSGSHAVAGLNIPFNVEVLSGISLAECHRLAAQATVNVVPIKDEHAASGQVTFLETMMLGKAIILTSCAGTRDYVESGINGILVAPNDIDALKREIAKLWLDPQLRTIIGTEARAMVLSSNTIPSHAKFMLDVLERYIK
ncbi:glycosyltransferase [Rhizobium rhododendri]|uniref:Glycosyltransferase n=1 Tax=Rhizobium rhododendri TaxID=2506430 RepID=A0ABY8IPI2_9HYPH|nr:glycosyltransferase [Rhizobium rhododendri]WFS25211.1 glycosyltransferase [Rhizobium rhododendri]